MQKADFFDEVGLLLFASNFPATAAHRKPLKSESQVCAWASNGVKA